VSHKCRNDSHSLLISIIGNNFYFFQPTSCSEKKNTGKMCKTTEMNWTICGHSIVKTEFCKQAQNPESLLSKFRSPCNLRRAVEYYYEICKECRQYWRAHGVSEDTAIEQYRSYREKHPNHGDSLSPHAYRPDQLPCLLRDGQIETGKRMSHASECPPNSEVVPIKMEVRIASLPGKARQRTGSMAEAHVGRENTPGMPNAQESTVMLWPSLVKVDGREARPKVAEPLNQCPSTYGYGGDLVRNTPGYQQRQQHPAQMSGGHSTPNQEAQDDYLLPRVYKNPYRDSRFQPPSQRAHLPSVNNHTSGFRDANGRVKIPPKNLEELFKDLHTDRPPPPLKRTRPLDFKLKRSPPLNSDLLNKPLPPRPRQDSPMPGAPFNSQNPDRDLPNTKYYRRVF
jgi:hypothetical protein